MPRPVVRRRVATAPLPRIKTRNPAPDKQGPRIPRWKYDAVRRAILRNIPARGSGVAFSDLARLVRDSLPRATLVDLGSVSWQTTVVKLDLEARGEVCRIAGVKPQTLLRGRKRRP